MLRIFINAEVAREPRTQQKPAGFCFLAGSLCFGEEEQPRRVESGERRKERKGWEKREERKGEIWRDGVEGESSEEGEKGN